MRPMIAGNEIVQSDETIFLNVQVYMTLYQIATASTQPHSNTWNFFKY